MKRKVNLMCKSIMLYKLSWIFKKNNVVVINLRKKNYIWSQNCKKKIKFFNLSHDISYCLMQICKIKTKFTLDFNSFLEILTFARKVSQIFSQILIFFHLQILYFYDIFQFKLQFFFLQSLWFSVVVILFNNIFIFYIY